MKRLLMFGPRAGFDGGPVLAQDFQPSKYGPADEIGAADLVTPERVLAATELIKHGKSHPLGIVVVPGMPAFPPRSVSLQVIQPSIHFGRPGRETFGWESLAMRPSPAVVRRRAAARWPRACRGGQVFLHLSRRTGDLRRHRPDEAGAHGIPPSLDGASSWTWPSTEVSPPWPPAMPYRPRTSKRRRRRRASRSRMATSFCSTRD